MTIKNVFLSYGRGDDEPFVAEMWQYLTDKGIFAWYDRKNMPSRGVAFTKEIADAIEQSERLILFIGAYSANSEWCEREWKHAYKFCIPITVVLIQHTFATLPKDIKSKFYDDIFEVDGLEFPPHLRDKADEKLYDKLTNSENLALAEPINVPPLQIYMDRPEYIATIKKQMRLSDPTDIKDFRTGIVAITSKDATTGVNGIAGIGKTTLASALAQDCTIRRNFQHILWIRVGNDKKRTDAPALLRAIADQLNPYEDQFKDQYLNEDTARIRVQSLLSDKRVLLILDDVWDRNLIEVFLFTSKTYKLVMTTRNRNLMHENMVEIDRLSDQDGVRLMTYYLNESAPQDVVIIPKFEQIVQTLHGHTLAIKIIATLLKHHGVYETPAYLDRLRDLKHKHLFSYLAEEENLTGDTQRNYDVELSFSLSYEKLTDDQKRRFRAIGIFAPNATYGIEALQAVWEIDDHLLAKQAITALQNVGLLDDDVNTGRYSHHPLLRAYALKLLNDEGEYEAVFGRYADFYIDRAGNIFMDLWDRPELWNDDIEGANYDDITNIKLLGTELTSKIQDNAKYELLNRAIKFSLYTKNYIFRRIEEGLWRWLEMGLNAIAKLHQTNEGHKYILYEASILSELGIYASRMGDSKKALSLYLRALALAQSFSEKEFIKIGGTIFHNIGRIYYNNNSFHSSMILYERSLFFRRIAGDKQGESTTLNSIGATYRLNKNFHEALRYYHKALSLCESQPNKLNQADCYNNLGLVYCDLKDYEKSFSNYDQALKLYRYIGHKWGEATIFNNLGGLYYEQGYTEKAIEHYLTCLSLRITLNDKYGEAITYSNIGLAYEDINDLDSAIYYFEKCVTLNEQIQSSNLEIERKTLMRLKEKRDGLITYPTKV